MPEAEGQKGGGCLKQVFTHFARKDLPVGKVLQGRRQQALCYLPADKAKTGSDEREAGIAEPYI